MERESRPGVLGRLCQWFRFSDLALFVAVQIFKVGIDDIVIHHRTVVDITILLGLLAGLIDGFAQLHCGFSNVLNARFDFAGIVGFQVIWNVSHALHTPLMAVTNAISGIVVVGALLQIGSGNWLVVFLSFIGVLIASINIVGGFLVTRRMLAMFQKS